tara:strand:+ start:14330 stop:14974 length:645 start_codon:yes stop_codon:yes gene_type:complete
MHLQRTRRSGFTLVELMIGLPILIIVVGVAGLAAQRGTEAFGQSTAIDALDRRAGRAMTAMTEALHGSVSTGFLPDPVGNFGSSTLTFQRQTGYVAGAAVLGTPVRIERVAEPADPANGVDDDGDGLIDEGMIQIVTDVGGPDEETRVVCRNVAFLLEGELPNGVDDNGNGLIDESGLSIHRQDGYITLRLTVVTPFQNAGLIRTIESSIGLRN